MASNEIDCEVQSANDKRNYQAGDTMFGELSKKIPAEWQH